MSDRGDYDTGVLRLETPYMYNTYWLHHATQEVQDLDCMSWHLAHGDRGG